MEVKTVYTLETATEEIREKILEKHWDINIDYEWWNCTCDELSELGLECLGFDIDRGSYCDLRFKLSVHEVAQNILNSHGESCDTWKTANNFIDAHDPIFSEYLNEDSDHYESIEYEDKLMEREEQFLKDLQEDYLSMLRREYDYLTSEEAITETIICNGYEFLENGDIY